MGNDTYLSYLVHELERWGKIGAHSIKNRHERTQECVNGVVDRLLACLYYNFPEVYKNLVQLVTKEGVQC